MHFFLSLFSAGRKPSSFQNGKSRTHDGETQFGIICQIAGCTLYENEREEEDITWRLMASFALPKTKLCKFPSLFSHHSAYEIAKTGAADFFVAFSSFGISGDIESTQSQSQRMGNQNSARERDVLAKPFFLFSLLSLFRFVLSRHGRDGEKRNQASRAEPLRCCLRLDSFDFCHFCRFFF